MQAIGINQTILAGFQMNFPAGTNMLVYLFDTPIPNNFNDMGFTPTPANLIRNCSNAILASISYPTITEAQLAQRSSLIKSADLVAKYAGEAVSVYTNGVVTGTAYPNHAVYAPKQISCWNDYRDHELFTQCMYKISSDSNFNPTSSYFAIASVDNEAVEFDYNRNVEVNCFHIKQGTAANTFMRQIGLDYWNGTAWVEILTTALNVAGQQFVRFNAVTATKFRMRKRASGTAGTVLLAFAYFGKTDYAVGDLMYNMATPQWAVIVPDYTDATVLSGLQARLPDSFGKNNVTSTDFALMASASGLNGTGRLRFNAPVQAQNDFKFDYYLSFGQLF